MILDTTTTATIDPGDPKHPIFWFDASDLFAFYPENKSVTGIQRVEIMLLLELFRQTTISNKDRAALRVCYFDAALGVYREAPAGHLRKSLDAFLHGKHRRASSFSKALISMIPKSLRPKRFFDTRLENPLDAPCAFHPGDVFVALGATWFRPSYVNCVVTACTKHQMRLCVLVHDLIPIRYPGWFPPAFVEEMKCLWDILLSRADLLLANSKYTAQDLVRYCHERHLRRNAPYILRFGDDLGLPDGGCVFPSSRTAHFANRGFVLSVGSICLRKNQALLLRVWERLCDAYGSITPHLVLVGTFLGAVEETILASSAMSHIVHFQDVSDVELADMYRTCTFTIFPSLAEGWGLPVAESLANGKLCLASNRTAIPEVGEALVEYFDPQDEDACYRLIERFFFNPGLRHAAEQRILAEYKSTHWKQTADTMLQIIADAFPKLSPDHVQTNASHFFDSERRV